MKPSLFLHQLIHTLVPAEEASFLSCLQSSKKGENSLYLKLFQEIRRQDAYDEAALRRAFAGTSFGKSLGFPKSHLYDRLLAHLQGRHEGAGYASSLRTALDKVELLAEKGLHDQANRMIDKGLKRAEEMEDATHALQLLRMKRRQAMQLQILDLPHEMDNISAQELHWEAALQREQSATRLHDDLFSLFQEVRRKTQVASNPRIQALWQQSEQLLADPGLGFPAKVIVLRARARYHHMREDFAAVHDAYQAEIETWEAHPLQIQNAQMRFVRLMGQWLGSKALLGDFEGLLAEVKRMRSRTDLDQRSEAEIFQSTYNLELYYYLNAGRPMEALPLMEPIRVGLQRYDALLPPGAKLGFYYNLALVHWLGGQPSAALKWVRQIEQFEKGTMRKDIREFAPLLEHILHFELGNTSLLESWFRAVKYRRKQASAPTMEVILADLMQKLLSKGNAGNHAQHFREFVVALDAFAEVPGISRLGIHELKEWMRLRGHSNI